MLRHKIIMNLSNFRFTIRQDAGKGKVIKRGECNGSVTAGKVGRVTPCAPPYAPIPARRARSDAPYLPRRHYPLRDVRPCQNLEEFAGAVRYYSEISPEL